MAISPLCNIKVTNLTPAEASELLTILKSSNLQVQDNKERTGIEEVALVITILAGVGQLTEQGVKLIQAIALWKSKRQESRTEQTATLEDPDSESLNLLTATDEEIEQWVEERVQWLSPNKD